MKKLIYFLSFAVGFGTLCVLAASTGFFQVRDIDVEIQTPQSAFLIPQQRKMEKKLDRLRGENLWNVHINELRHKLMKQAWVKSVEIERRLPGYLEIQVVPRKVWLVLLRSQDRFLPVVDDGNLLEPIPSDQVPDVPILRGDNFYKSSRLRLAAIDLIKQIPAKGNFSSNAISEISFTEKAGFVVRLRRSSARVELGLKNFAQKASRISRILTYLDARALEGRVIDATFSKKVLVRLRKGP